MSTHANISRGFAVCLLFAAAASTLPAADQPQWGQLYTRNMVSDEKNLPDTFDPATGENIKWAVRTGTQTYGTPVVARGRVLVGTNNGRPRDPRHMTDRGVLLCLNEADGKLLWTLIVPKLKAGYADWRNTGIASTPTIVGDRVYLVDNRGTVLCLDLAGQANGNDGPFRNEGRQMAPAGAAPMEVRKADADIVWAYDMREPLGVRQHDAMHTSILVYGRYAYVCTANGVDATHFKLPAPQAPSLIVLDKATGRLVAIDNEPIGPQLIHCMWSSPAVANVAGRNLILFGAGDCVCYAFEALTAPPPTGRLRTVWKFHCDPAGRKERPLDFQDNRTEGPSTINGMAVFHKGKVYVTAGGDPWHGKPQAWIKCIDPRGKGDITKTNLIWSRPLNRFCLSTPAIHDGLVYVADWGRTIHCFDAETGRPHWKHTVRGEIWASTLVADGKVYGGTRRGSFCILAAGKEKKLLATVRLGRPISASPVAANGVLYVATPTHLYAVKKGARLAKP